MLMWMLSKCVHMAGVGFAKRPIAKVSEASKKLKSSGTKGRGTGKSGSIANLPSSAVVPIAATAQARFRASLPKVRSTLLNHAEPRLGKAKAKQKTTRARRNSKKAGDGLLSGAEDKIMNYFRPPLGLIRR